MKEPIAYTLNSAHPGVNVQEQHFDRDAFPADGAGQVNKVCRRHPVHAAERAGLARAAEWQVSLQSGDRED